MIERTGKLLCLSSRHLRLRFLPALLAALLAGLLGPGWLCCYLISTFATAPWLA